MRPATICFPFVGDLVGGSHLSATGLIAGLDPARFRPMVVLQSDGGVIAELMARHGIAVTCAPSSPQLEHGRPVGAWTAARLLAAAPALGRFLRRHRVDIVHCNDGRTLATWALPAKLAGAKLLWHHRGSPRAAGLRFVAPALADQVIAVSRFAAPAPGRYSAHARTAVIHSPFDTEMRHDRDAARRAIAGLFAQPCTPETRFVAFSGALIERKRPLLFVETIALLRQAMPGQDIRGVLLGESLDDTDQRVRGRAEQLGVGDQVVCAGFRSPGPFWLAGCDLLLVPAVDEPFGRTLIEAMLVGTPVVATASGGNVEAICDGSTGLLAPPEDAAGLARACARMLQDSLLQQRVIAAANGEATARYGAAAHVRAVSALYDRLLARRPVRAGRPHQLAAAYSPASPRDPAAFAVPAILADPAPLPKQVIL